MHNAGVGGRRDAMVLDFGIATLLDAVRDEHFVSLTKQQEIIGTPSYMAPEQLAKARPRTQSDLYTWGLILIECLTGRPAVLERRPCRRRAGNSRRSAAC